MIGERTHMNFSFQSRRESQTLGTLKHPAIVLGHLGLLTETLEARLKNLGYRVNLAKDGDCARKFACRGHVEAVILPVEVKGESAFLTCVKLLAGSPHTRVYLYGPKSDTNLRDAFLAGATGYFDDATTANQIVDVLSGK